MFRERMPQFFNKNKEKKPSEEEHSPENLIKEGEEKKDSIIERIREEGEMTCFKSYQGISKIMRIEKSNIMDFESWKERKETKIGGSTSRSEKLMWAIPEVSYGALSMGARKIIEKILKGTTDFSQALSRISDKASKRFKDARSLYKIEE